MAWADVQKTTVSFRGFLGISILAILLLGALNWMFVLLSGMSNPYYTEMDGTLDAKTLKGQDSFEVATPVAKDMLHFLGKRMSKGLRVSSMQEKSEYDIMQTAKEAGPTTDANKKHISKHDALKGLTSLQFVVYLLVFLAFLWFFVALAVTKTTKLGAKLGIETN